MPAENYLAGLGVLPDPLGAINKQIAFQSGIDAQQVENEFKKSQIAAAAVKQQRTQQAQAAVQSVLANPTAQNISGLMMQFPELADDFKKAWDLKDKAAQKADFHQMSELWSAIENGRPDLAAQAARRRYEADREAGIADDMDLAVVEMLESGDPAQIAKAKGLVGMGIKAAGGAEHFGSVSNALDPKLGATNGIVWDERTGEVKGQLPGAGIRTVEGVGIFNVEIPGVETLGGGSATGTIQGGSTTPVAPLPEAQSTVASALSSAGFPSHVVAGFLGNFDVEGGYGGAKGDGGKAAGIAQWHPDRQRNFQRVIGKPVSQATPAEQAQFVVWEMQNPQAAGMTVKQRDAILNAKSAPQAAALIDQYYERSSGKDRKKRMSAAERFASSGTYYGAVPPEAVASVSGKQYYKINGQWFDNPEGK